MTHEQLAILFRRNLTELREAKGWTQSDLARQMERAPSYVCDLERGRREPTLRTLAALALALGATADALLSFDPSRPPQESPKKS